MAREEHNDFSRHRVRLHSHETTLDQIEWQGKERGCESSRGRGPQPIWQILMGEKYFVARGYAMTQGKFATVKYYLF
jgi:hypothetical protein